MGRWEGNILAGEAGPAPVSSQGPPSRSSETSPASVPPSENSPWDQLRALTASLSAPCPGPRIERVTGVRNPSFRSRAREVWATAVGYWR